MTEEADESQFWLDITITADILSNREARRLLQEATELTAIFTASRETATRHLAQSKGSASGAAAAAEVNGGKSRDLI